MNILIIYSNDLYQDRADALKEKAKGIFDKVINFTEEFIRGTDFFEENKDILEEKRGAGYWLWKPFILLNSFQFSNPDDTILYIDCGDTFNERVLECIKECLVDSDICLTEGDRFSFIYTKRDCFHFMNCDEEKYWNSRQIEAGIIVFRPTQIVKKIFEDWLYYCCDRRILTDDPNQKLENFPGFIDHRHDQSVLNCIAISNNLKISSQIRKSVTCNVND